MKRKVIQIADSTQLVSLPRKWALQHGVKKGDEIEVTVENNRLIVTPDTSQREDALLELSIPDSKNFLRRFLFSPYIQGYTEIKVNFRDGKTFEQISNQLELLMGYEIIQQGDGYCVIKRIATAMDNDFDSVLNRIFISSKTMMEDIALALTDKDFEKLHRLESMELTNNKLSYFCLRLLNLKGYKDSKKTNSIYYIILLVEQLTDTLRDICRYCSDKKVVVSSEVVSLLRSASDEFEFVYKLFRKFDSNELIPFNRRIGLLVASTREELARASKNALVLAYILSVLDLVSHISKEIHY